MVEENIIQEFRLKNLDEIKNSFIEEINQIELISNFASLIGIPTDIMNSTVTLKVCAKTTGSKNRK